MTDAEFQAVFDQHKDAVYRFAWRMSRSPAAAEDITQDVFVGLLRFPGRFDPARGTLRAFLLGIARNLALKHWRAEHRFESLDEDAVAAESLDLERGDVGDIVGRAVGALRPLQREVVILVEYEGLTLAEVARAVDADIGTVKSRLHRARENLRRMLAPLRSTQPTTT
ncbi:MAG TPA: RNA polymerase sigma factor [Vicinamibacterales bacterium]|nr:RNA polymerase sigma factor [Vicinamibacterales bacterium]